MKSEISISMTVKIQKGCIITLFFLFTFIALVNITIGSNLIDSDRFSDKIEVRDFENEGLQYSKISSIISINGNQGWVNAKAAGICTGSGNWSDPYVIEDLVIDGQNSGSCILIENSDVYFRIENCTVYNSGSNGWDDAGIELRLVNNGELINNTANNNTQAGIYLGSSSNNTISGNTANYNSQYAGIYLKSSSNNTISGNTVYNNSNGIFLDLGSNNNTVSGNTANSNTDAGIYLDLGSNNNTVSGNTANSNTDAGIYLDWSSNNNKISDNIASNNNRMGINLLNCDTNTISGNTIYNNRMQGIHLRDSNYNTISDNIASDNNTTGIILYDCDNNTISGNTVNYNSQYGIELWDSNYNNISRNNLTYNTPFLDAGGLGNIYENNIVDVPTDLSSLILVLIIIGFSIILVILGSGFIYVMRDKKKKSIQSELIATEEEEKEEIIKPEFNIFISYSTLDSKYLQIRKCVKNLEKFPEIEKAYFWEVDSKANIVEFMDETLKKTNVFIFFCTENSMNSNSVKNEWQAAFQRTNKGLMKIIPVYEDEDLIPPLLGHFLNVKFTKDDFKGFVEKLYQEILR